MQLRSRKSRSARVPSLLELPDAVVELVAAHLPPRCMAQLQTTCKHMQQLLGHDRYTHSTLITAIAVAPRPSYLCRLWEVQLTDNNQEWAAAGIVPVSGRKQGQTWKELVETACKLESWMPEHLPAFAHTLDFTTAPYSKLHALECVREMWNAGDHHFTHGDRH